MLITYLIIWIIWLIGFGLTKYIVGPPILNVVYLLMISFYIISSSLNIILRLLIKSSLISIDLIAFLDKFELLSNLKILLLLNIVKNLINIVDNVKKNNKNKYYFYI